MRLFVLILAFVPLGICHPKLSRIFWCLEQIADILNPADYDTITLFIQKDEKKKEGYMFAHVPSPIAVALRGDLNETLCDMSTMSSYLKDCLNDNDKTAKLNPVINRTATLCKLAKEMEENDEDKHSELAKCLKGLKAGDKNWLKDTCPDYDYFISPNLTDLEGSCCKDSQNLKCVLGYISGKCDKFINDVYVFKYRVAYTLLEIHHNETSKKDEKYPDKCHALATGSGAIGRNPRGNTSTWTLIYLALLSWAVQSAVGMIEKFGR